MHSDSSDRSTAVNFSHSRDVGTGVTVDRSGGPEPSGQCAYCRRYFGESLLAVPHKGIRTALKKSGIQVLTPCCQKCLNQITTGHKNSSTRAHSLYVRTALKEAQRMVQSDRWERGEFSIRKALKDANLEISQIEGEIKRLFDDMERLSRLRNDIFSASMHVRETLLRRELKSYPARRREADRIISDPVLRQRIFSRDGFVCLECGSLDDLSIDHFIPVFHGGSNEDRNLRTLCTPCNSKKGAKLLREIERIEQDSPPNSGLA